MRILFVHNALRSFVRYERDMLASRFEVDELDLSVRSRTASLPLRLARADLVYVWFAGAHAMGPVLGAALMRKPSAVRIGGYDVAAMPEIGYGHMAHPGKCYVVRSVCRAAAMLLPFSEAAAEETRRNVSVATPIRVLYPGIIIPRTPPDFSLRERTVVTVARVTRETIRRKNLETFVRTAAQVPDVRFVLGGEIDADIRAHLLSLASANIEIPGFVPQGELDALLGRASVYVQASLHEGFGCAMAEAMAHGCVPVIAPRGSLPEVVGEHGVMIRGDSTEALAEAIRQALTWGSVERSRAAAHVRVQFGMQRLERELPPLIEALVRDSVSRTTSEVGA